jgi:hypothetical protein
MSRSFLIVTAWLACCGSVQGQFETQFVQAPFPMPGQGSPVYSVTAIVNPPSLNPKEKVSIDVFFNGTKPISYYKFAATVPPLLLAGVIEGRHIGFSADTPGVPLQVVTAPLSSQFVMTFSSNYFQYTKDSILYCEARTTNPNAKTFGDPPLQLSFEISKNAPPGDHSIYLQFFYGDDRSAALAERVVMIHIRSFGERFAQPLSGVLAGLLVFATWLVDHRKSMFEGKKWFQWIFWGCLLITAIAFTLIVTALVRT